jgi:hypothetical protein
VALYLCPLKKNLHTGFINFKVFISIKKFKLKTGKGKEDFPVADCPPHNALHLREISLAALQHLHQLQYKLNFSINFTLWNMK